MKVGALCIKKEGAHFDTPSCRFLATPIEQLPTTDKEKAKLFSKVYREAKSKGVLECPHYRSLFIDEVLENINKSNVTLQTMN